MKLITILLVASIAPMANAASKPIKKAKDLNRVSMNCAHIEVKSVKARCKEALEKDLNRVSFKGKARKALTRR